MSKTYTVGRSASADIRIAKKHDAVGKLHIDEDQIGARLERRAALRAAFGFDDLEVIVGEIASDHRARDRIVLDDDQPFAARRIG